MFSGLQRRPAETVIFTPALCLFNQIVTQLITSMDVLHVLIHNSEQIQDLADLLLLFALMLY